MSLESARRLAVDCGYIDAKEAGTWRGFTIYEPVSPPTQDGGVVPSTGIPDVILERGGELRFSDYDETFEYFYEAKLGKTAP